MVISNDTWKNNGSTTMDVSYPIVFWTFLGIEILFIVLGNAMLCWLFSTRKNLRTQQNYFIASLSFSDLLVGLTVAPCEYCALPPQWNNSFCISFCGTLTSFNMLASTMNLIFIAADRYFAITRPFRYNEVLTKTRIRAIIFTGWCITFLLVLLPFTWNTSGDHDMTFVAAFIYMEFLFAFIILVGISLGICYYSIVRIVRKKLKDSSEKSSNPAGIKVCILVAISFFICWIPTGIMENLLHFRQEVPQEIKDATYFIMLVNPALDPLMYAYYRRDFRKELVNCLRSKWSFMKKNSSFLNRAKDDINHNQKHMLSVPLTKRLNSSSMDETDIVDV